jgi:cell division protein FtsW
LRILYTSYFIKDTFAKSILIGVSITLLAQTFLNMGSVSGAIPLTGVPLPLISHGSTSLIFTLGMLGICTQILGRREIYKVEV